MLRFVQKASLEGDKCLDEFRRTSDFVKQG